MAVEQRTKFLLKGLPFVLVPLVAYFASIVYFEWYEAPPEPYHTIIITAFVLFLVASELWGLRLLGRTFVGKFDLVAVVSVLTAGFGGYLIFFFIWQYVAFLTLPY